MDIASTIIADYLLIKATGKIVDFEELKSLAKGLYDEIARHDMNRAIIDVREVQFPISYEQATRLAYFLSEALPEEIRHWKIACIVSRDIKAIAEYWESHANQHGYNYKVFSSINEAREFLNS